MSGNKDCKKFLIFIRVDGSGDIGLGHLMRCRAIADSLASYPSLEIKFIISSLTERDAATLPEDCVYSLLSSDGNKKEALELGKIMSQQKVDLLITDSYFLSDRFYVTLKAQNPVVPVIAIDDFGEKADMLLSGFISFGLSADRSLYPSNLLKYSAIGPEYFPLRREFLLARSKNGQHGKPVKRVLVTMGGSDPENQTVRIAALLKRLRSLEIIDVLLGPAYTSREEIIKITSDDNRFVLHQSPSDVALIMEKADLAITGGGTTCNELVYLGVPVAVLVLAENQERMAAAVERFGCGRSLGYFRAVSDDSLFQAIKDIINAPSSLAAMSDRGRKIIDGRGGERLAEYINNFMDEYHTDRYKTSDVLVEYESSASLSTEFEKVKWGSENGMLNRFHLAINIINWHEVEKWLDVGSGTGAFLEEVEKHFTMKRFVGLDISPSMTKFAASKVYKTKNCKFICQSFMCDLEDDFDLVTCIGVLHKCGVSLRKAVARLSELTRPGGQIFATTKNLDWNKFKKAGYEPYPGHHWFRSAEIQNAFMEAGLAIVKMEGFEPRERYVTCSPEESHSLYILARKKS